jgi:hypothetical protein
MVSSEGGSPAQQEKQGSRTKRAISPSPVRGSIVKYKKYSAASPADSQVLATKVGPGVPDVHVSLTHQPAAQASFWDCRKLLQ